MITLAWLWKRRWYVVIAAAALTCVVSLLVKLWRADRRADEYAAQLATYDVVSMLHEGAYQQQTAMVELYETLIREYNPQPTTELAYQAQVKVIYKTRTVTVPVIERVIEYRDKLITIDAKPAAGETCDGGTCAVDLSYTLAPLKFDLFVTRVKGKYATIVDTHNADVTVEMATKLDPAVFQDDRPWFAGVGPLVRLHTQKQDYSWYDLGLGVEVGYLFNKWYIQGQVQYLGGFGAGVMFGGRW